MITLDTPDIVQAGNHKDFVLSTKASWNKIAKDLVDYVEVMTVFVRLAIKHIH